MTNEQKETIKQEIANLRAAALAAVPNAIGVTLKVDWANEMALTEVTVFYPNRSGYETFAVPSTSLPPPE